MTTAHTPTRQGKDLRKQPRRPPGVDVMLGGWATLGTTLFGLGALTAGAWWLTVGAWLAALLAAAYTTAAYRADRRRRGR